MSFCVQNPIIGQCPGTLMQTCSFYVSQKICVQIPLHFSATASTVKDGLICGTLATGEYPEAEFACTHTIGFFKNHPEITNALIEDAGGTITLGGGSGLSFVVDTSNANTVLTFNTPSPPAPGSPPFSGQYQVLYAQLLAAKLNIQNLLNQGSEICTFIQAAILAADTFLDASPVGGMAGAGNVQDPLAQFNEGNAPGCPLGCDD